MTNTSQRLAAYLGCGCALLLAACGNASGSNPPSTHTSKLVRAPWSQIAHAKHHPTTLLINTAQDTADRSSPCFTHYTTRVVTETSHRISIELLAPNTEGRSFQCTSNGVGGPFLVPVHLKKRYRGQKLLDPVTGRFHHLIPRSKMS
jgi:hypothetical protein